MEDAQRYEISILESLNRDYNEINNLYKVNNIIWFISALITD